MELYINAFAHYLPDNRVPNSYFKDVNGLDDEWIRTRTGISTRSKAGENENTNTMALEAVKRLHEKLPFPIEEVDLIVAATYSPHDTVATAAHMIQRHFKARAARCLTVSAACSSFINAMEIVEGYFAMNKATKAIVVASEHNTEYSYMIEGLNAVTNSQGIKLTDLKFIASHQANKRIMATVARQIDFPEDHMLSNIEEVGNTGCPSCAIALSQNLDRVDHGDLVALSVFGGGYSCGAVLLQFL